MFWKIYFLIGSLVGLFFCVHARRVIENPEKYDPSNEVLPLIETVIDQIGDKVFYLGIFLMTMILYPMAIVTAVFKM